MIAFHPLNSRHTGREVPSRDIGASAFARLCSGKLGSGTGYGALLESEQLPANELKCGGLSEAGAVPTQQTRKHCPGQRLDGPHGEMAG